jgi:hypothetical protein
VDGSLLFILVVLWSLSLLMAREKTVYPWEFVDTFTKPLYGRKNRDRTRHPLSSSMDSQATRAGLDC